MLGDDIQKSTVLWHSEMMAFEKKIFCISYLHTAAAAKVNAIIVFIKTI